MEGKVYERLTDACSFGLLEKARGRLKATDLAKQALDPYDFSVANNGKAKALRTISIIDKAFNVWNRTLPTADAPSVRIAEITGIERTICKKHVPNLQKRFNDAFPT